MLTGVVCYVERTPGGSGLRRLRLVGPELDRTWVAPGMSGPEGGPTKPVAPGEQLAHIRAAAEWIGEEIAPVRELVAVCLDPEGGVCSWVSSPSAAEQVIVATIRQSGGGHGAEMNAGGAGGAGGSSGFGLLPDDTLGIGGARSVQALAEPELKARPLPGAKKSTAVGPRKRLGVLSVADAPVRVLLDELDAQKIGVGAVLSFWHAAVLAWDPSVPSAADRKKTSENGTHEVIEPIVIEAAAPVTAAVVVDPAGRLLWAWSAKGDLLAAGTLKLRTHTLGRGAPPAPATEMVVSADSGILELPSAARVVDESAELVTATECSRGDVGRLVMDWLAWSVQIGRTPERVICIGPATLPERPGSGEAAPTPESVARSLAAAWPGAAVDAAVHEDPIGATLNRLRALPMFAPTRTSAGAEAGSGAGDDPRRNLVTLSRRPGRFDRALHYWATLAILAAAVAVFLYGRRLGNGVEDVRSRLAAVQKERTELLQSAEDVVPAVSKMADPIGMLSTKIQEYTAQLSQLTTSTPALARIIPALEILNEPEFANVQVSKVSASDFSIEIDLSVPDNETDALLPPAVRGKLDAKFGAGKWDGAWGQSRNGRRPYQLFWRLPGDKTR